MFHFENTAPTALQIYDIILLYLEELFTSLNDDGMNKRQSSSSLRICNS